MTLSEAIAAVETADQAYGNAVNQTTNDQAAADAIQAKLDAANATVAADKQTQNTAAGALNTALDQAIEVFTAAKIAVA